MNDPAPAEEGAAAAAAAGSVSLLDFEGRIWERGAGGRCLGEVHVSHLDGVDVIVCVERVRQLAARIIVSEEHLQVSVERQQRLKERQAFLL